LKQFRNIKPFHPVPVAGLVNHTGNKIASKALIENGTTEMRFFSFAEGESIDKEYYSRETLILMIEGEIKILYNENDEVIIGGGELIALEAEIYYGLAALKNSKLLAVMAGG